MRWIPIPLLFVLGCVDPLPVEDRPCECGPGWVCCEDNICYPRERGCGADAGTESADAGPPKPEWGELESVEVVSPYCYALLTAPEAGTEDWLVAARLTPPAYPFRVERVQYALMHGLRGQYECDAGRAHEVLLFASEGTKPAARPEVLQTHSIDDMANIAEDRTVELSLEQPIVLERGDLVVALRGSGKYPNVTCFGLCPSSERNRSFLSMSSKAPYGWTELMTLGFEENLSVGIEGRRTLP